MNHEMITAISKGQQVTIPAEMRNELGLHAGSLIDIEQHGKKIVIQSVGEDLEKLFEEAKKIKPKRGLTPEQMDELNERMFR